MRLMFISDEKRASVTIDCVDEKKLKIKGHGSAITYLLNGKIEIIGVNTDQEKVSKYMDRIRLASREPDARICYTDKHLERLEIVYGN